jgi:GT2 family glycosyltransferase
MIDISVIIVSYNTSKLTAECLESVNSCSKNLNVEVVVVDNASGDSTVVSIKKQKKELTNIKLGIVENKNNLGFAKAVNIGIAAALGKYIFLLNSDTRITNGVFEKLIEFAKSKKDAAVVVPRLINDDGSAQGSVFRFPSVTRAVKQYWMGDKGLLDKYSPKSNKPTTVEVASMAAFLITPKCLDKVGLLDERFFMYYEDFDYCRRIKRKGLKVYYYPLAEVFHHHGASGKDLTSDATQWKRLIPSSKIYNGLIKHYVINFVIWTGQKLNKES